MIDPEDPWPPPTPGRITMWIISACVIIFVVAAVLASA